MTTTTGDCLHKVYVIGFGVTGKAIAYVLSLPSNRCIDTLNKETVEPAYCYILCLPTPTVKGRQDISAIEEWVPRLKKLNKNALVILRSTVLPGTTDKLIKKYGMKIVFVPEFLTESTALEDAENPEFMVIGTDDVLLRKKVYNIFAESVNPKLWIYCSPTTAEMVKYTMNCFFALKVVYGNQLWDLCKQTGANYEILRETLENHKWGSKNGWNVWHNNKRGFAGKCLPKDVEAISNFSKLPLLSIMKEINDKLLKDLK
jgi:UDPglucose 6-dehydrogenase